MKKALLVAIAAFSTYAFACPNLTGNYQCQDEQETWGIQVTQSVRGGVTTYSVTDDDGVTTSVIADGVSRPMPADPDFREGMMAATCMGNQLGIESTGKIYMEDQYVGFVDLQLVMSIGNGGNLIQDADGTLTLSDGEVWDLDSSMTCTRL